MTESVTGAEGIDLQPSKSPGHHGSGLLLASAPHAPRVLGDAPSALARPLLSGPTGNEVWKVYYYAGAQLIAMRVLTGTTGNTLYYLHSDHLGSTSLTTCGNSACGTVGSVVARQWYHPYGTVRASSGALPTDITFTGQWSESSELGSLMFFRARFYSPLVGRFLSADTIVPNQDNAQAWNRYAYVLNNPLRHVDPTGHGDCDPQTGECENDNDSDSGDDPEWWLPFTYDTLAIDSDFVYKSIGGLEVGLTLNLNMKALREFDFDNFDVSVNVSANVSVGLSAEVAGTITFTGSDGSVSDQRGLSVIGFDGVSVNAIGCLDVCAGGGGTIDLSSAKNGFNSSSSWTVGGGEGVDLSVDVISVSDSLVYSSNTTTQWQIPFLNLPFWQSVFGLK